MTTFLMNNNVSTKSISYHSIAGFVHVIPRPTLVGVWKEGVFTNAACVDRYGNKRFVLDIWLDKLVGECDAYIVQLGDGTSLSWHPDSLVDHDGRRMVGFVEDATAIATLPAKIDMSHLKPFIF